jgi:hypothetical protein
LRFSEEWGSHIDAVPGDLSKLVVALGFVVAAWRIAVVVKLASNRIRVIYAIQSVENFIYSIGAMWSMLAFSSTLAFSVIAVFVMIQAKPPGFDGDRIPIPVSLFAGSRYSCNELDQVVKQIQHSQYHMKLKVNGSCETDPKGRLPVNVMDGTVSLIVGATVMVRGGKADCGERDGSDGRRAFFIILDASSVNLNSLAHELDHIVAGHTAVEHALPVVVNAMLDFAVTLDLSFGRDWPPVATLFGSTFLVLWLKGRGPRGTNPPPYELTILHIKSES